MKKIFALNFVSFVFSTFCHAQWYPYKPDPVITPAQMQRLHAISPSSAAAAPRKPRRVLVFSRTCDFRHNQGIVTINHLLRHTGEKTGAWEAVVSDDLANFEPEALRRFDCVVLNNSTGMPFAEPVPELEKMPPKEQARIYARDARLRDNLIDYVETGGGLAAFHAGADAYRRKEQYYARFIDMIGGNFVGHPWRSNDTTVSLVEDRDSPVTRGLWPEGEFVAKHETYMFGDAFDRTKLRVLLALDMERSPKRDNARADGDCALVWIKQHGKGRVAYSGFGHNMGIFFVSGIQDLHMRLIQFACGDLDADTAPLPKPARPGATSDTNAAVPPLYPIPDAQQVRQLEHCDFGSDEAGTNAINDLVFAVYHYNNNGEFCGRMGTFLLDELAGGKGTPRYRMILAQLVEAVGVGKSGERRLANLIDNEKDEAVRSRLEEAAAHRKRASSLTQEKELVIPPALPSSAREQARLIDYLGDRPWLPLPEYLTFENLGDAMRPRLVYALVARGKNEAGLQALKVTTPELALALGYAFSKNAKDENTFKRLLSFAPMLDKEQAAQMAVYLAQSSLPARADILAKTLGSQDSSMSALVASALALMDLSQFGRKFLVDYDTAGNDEKRAMLKVCESLADEYVFCEIARLLLEETSAPLRAAMQRALMRISQAVFTRAMFTAVDAAYAQTPQIDATAKAFWLRFAPLQGDATAIALCKRAHADGLKNDAIKTLGAWKTSLALDTLISMAKETCDERERLLAQTMIIALMERAGADAGAVDYILENAVTEETKDSAKRINNDAGKKK